MNLLEHVTIHTGDAVAVLRTLKRESVDCVVTSPPYWGLRDYKAAGQMGLEETPQLYIRRMVQVFRQVRRVLKNDGTCWVNIGDSYIGNGGQYGNAKGTLQGSKHSTAGGARRLLKRGPKLKRKDLCLVPARLVIALQEDGWYVRNDIIWHKRNGMPSSVRDRFTQNHEYIFFLAKSERYHFDQDAVKEPCKDPEDDRRRLAAQRVDHKSAASEKVGGLKARKSGNTARVYGVNVMNPNLGRNVPWEGTMRNKRTVWDVPTACYAEEHFAVFPPALIEPCILAGCQGGGTVLDPFGGSGTTAGVAVAHGRKAILIELNADYTKLMPARIEQVVRALRDAPAPKPQPIEQQRLFDHDKTPEAA